MQQLAIDISDVNPVPSVPLKQRSGSDLLSRDHHKASVSIHGSKSSSNALVPPSGTGHQFRTGSQPESSRSFERRQQTSKEKGSLTTVTVSHEGAIQPVHLLPMLAKCSHRERWLMWLSPYRSLNKEWLANQELGDAPVVHIDLCPDTQKVLCEKVLSSGNSHMIIEWQGDLKTSDATLLRALAESSGSHAIIIQRQA